MKTQEKISNSIQSAGSTVVEPAASVSSLLALLAKPRLEPYMEAFKPASDSEHLGAYMWGQAVSASLHPLLGLLEVVLRNAIHKSLSLQCSRGKTVSYAWYDKAENNGILLRGKSKSKVDDLLFEGTPQIRKAIAPTPDMVVSRLSFGFWPNVLEELTDRHAPKTFLEVFSAHPHNKPKYWGLEENKEQVVLRLKKLQALRNRVCHFEAVWKPHWIGATSSSYSHAIQGLRTLHDDLVELLGWCSPEAVKLYKASFGWNWLNRLCTTHATKAFMADYSACAKIESFSPAPVAIAVQPPSS